MVIAAVERKLEIIGEALKPMEANFHGSTGALPKVKPAMGMRDRLAHGYFDTDLEIIWKTVHYELPSLKLAVEQELARSQIDLGEVPDE